MTSSNLLSVSVKWAGKLFTIDDFDPAATTVGDLKSAIQAKTNVMPARQKLLNLKFKGQGCYSNQYCREIHNTKDVHIQKIT